MVKVMEGASNSFIPPRGGGGGRGGVLPYIDHISMCRPKGLGFVPFRSENGV